ncbi:2-oxoisovalerate dehydrogenase subunit alpha 2, mitochondrial-like [Cynara cardunculus var. scolymus]|uniref:2-oxoisovalerate dehydrogenase subunit alpha 2, mitochondrial-like n=1 Tax=Cynara cardunculus var. scolymus TaxID=59895 RepID=UPI000D62D36B|nr:2-oxoisovalerate dehydrogenase subunit alpha 2, mitochondrial-like [Cynara cardunculus var. scolymus]
MASSCFSKSKTIIMRNLKSKNFFMLGFINHTYSITNLQFPRHLLHTISSPPLPVSNYASSSPYNYSIAFSRCFASVYGGRRLNTATSVRNSVDQLSTEAPLQQDLDFPGGRVKFTPKPVFTSSSTEERTPCYRVLNDNGQPILDGDSVKISKELAVKMYTNMVTLQVMDTIFYEAQRQGRISFYLTTIGEEAINIASAAALNYNDFVFPQYREPGVLLWRGFTLQDFADQCFGNKNDNGKGRQMPIHYGSRKHNYFTVASTVGTQIPHAVGAAYSLKMEKQDACTVTYFGDGGSSTGDFHAALNFAAVMEVPVIFFCRNNGWAISTPINDQLRSDGIVVRGKAYGVPSIRVDGNDALAIYSAVHKARKMAIEEQTPVLIEALTYRAGHHSTSDDSTKYRPVDEIERWRGDQNPLKRFRKWIETKGWWSDEAESEHRNGIRKQLSQAIQAAERVEKPPISDIFNDVYDIPSKNLTEQEAFLRRTIQKHAQDYPSNVPM